MGSPRGSQGGKSGGGDHCRSATVVAKLGSDGRLAGQAGPGHLGSACNTGCRSRADVGLACGTRCTGRGRAGIRTDLGNPAGPIGSGA